MAIGELAVVHLCCVSNDHLPYYLDEYIFRFNRRTARKRGLLVYDSFSKP